MSNVWDNRHAGSGTEQIEFTGEAERYIGAQGDLEGSVVNPRYENAATCCFLAEQVAGLLKLHCGARRTCGKSGRRPTSNVKVYGGGVAEDGFLRALSDLIGDYSYTNVSVSSGKSGSSRSRQEGKERFDISNLAELDRGRAVVLASGAPATLVRTLPWYTGAHKEAVEASIKTYSPRPEAPAVPAAVEPAANPWVTT